MEQEGSLIVSEQYRDALEKVLVEYERALDLDIEALSYLSEERGLTPETIRGHRLGIVTDPLPEHMRYEGWLAIPYLGVDGRPLTIRFRCLKDHDHKVHGGKYGQPSGETTRLYGVDHIQRFGDWISICEGEIDAMTLRQAGYHAIGIPGAQSWKPHWSHCLDGYNRVFVWADGDEAGGDMVSKIRSQIRSAEAVRVPKGCDVNSVYVESGLDGLTALLDRKEPYGDDNG